MYSPVTLILKYLRYYLTASNGKGHGVHSPFVFNFITKILNDTRKPGVFNKIEQVRKALLRNTSLLTIKDFGAGSAVAKANRRSIRQIATSSLKPKKFGQLFFRMVQYYKPFTIVELGTSLGITASYFAAANPTSKVYTLEGSESVANVAHENFQQLGISNISLIRGNFNDTLPVLLQRLNAIDLAFIDGNHRRQPTINYFEQLLKKADENSVFIFDDIHWSREMEEAWQYIQQHPSVTLSIDLFFIGIIFFRKEQKVQQHFTVRF
nr:Methyltransferase domain protein [uncultured bacterium]